MLLNNETRQPPSYPCPLCGVEMMVHSHRCKKLRHLDGGVKVMHYDYMYCRGCQIYHGGYRHNRWTPEAKATVVALLKAGMPGAEIARRHSVPMATISDWRRRYC